MKKKYIHCISNGPKGFIGGTINVGGVLAYDPESWTAIRENQEIQDAHTAGEIRTSYDGVNILPEAESLDWLNSLCEGEEQHIKSNSVNYQSRQLRPALDEIADLAVNKVAGAVIPMSFHRNGSGNNKWGDVKGNSIASSHSPDVIPWDCRLAAITFSNNVTSADYDLQVWASALGDGTTKVLMYEHDLIDARVGLDNNLLPLNIDFDSGDKIAMFFEDQGKNPNDLIATLWFLVKLNPTVVQAIENYSGNFAGGGGSS